MVTVLSSRTLVSSASLRAHQPGEVGVDRVVFSAHLEGGMGDSRIGADLHRLGSNLASTALGTALMVALIVPAASEALRGSGRGGRFQPGFLQRRGQSRFYSLLFSPDFVYVKQIL
jgi:hypothetical protein